MSLSDQLIEIREATKQNVPADTYAAMMKATKDVIESKIAEKAPKVGQKLLNFNLPNALGEMRSLNQLLANGPLVLTFYRGGWCPYCNLELQAYQQVLGEIKAAGATLVAITPELPDASLSTSEKNELAFEVLTDKNAAYANQLGIVFTLAEELRPIYLNFGIDIEKHNGEKQFELPLAATFIIDTDGTISSAFVDADYTVRQEPSDVVETLNNHVVA